MVILQCGPLISGYRPVMKVYFPINIDFYEAETVKLFGWRDESSADIFICSNFKPKLSPELKVNLILDYSLTIY